MATTKSFQLYINNDNVKQYFTTSGGALNGAAIGGKYITMRSSSTTSTFTMKDAGRDVLFPSAEAKAYKVEVWAQTIATLKNSKNTINVAVAGQNVIDRQNIKTSLTEHTGGINGHFAKAATSVVYTIKIANGFQAAGVRDTSITAYFQQYSCAANAVGNGVKRVSVSNAEPYEGETVTFSAEFYNGATWNGWYSDAACTNLVSTEQIYTTSAADLTLYANATIEAAIYNCSAVAGENITSATVSDESVVSGESVTFTAVLNDHCTFDGWFSDSNYITLVSTANPYTAVITSDTALYAKATKISYSISVGTAEHGTATVSSSTAHYGDSVTFTFTPEDETWELYGWYSDEGLTQLVSESNPYTYTVTDNVVLYPKIGIKRYTITLTTSKEYYHNSRNEIISYDYALLTETEISYLKTGEFDKIDQNKIYARSSVEGTQGTTQKTTSIKCPFGYAISIYLSDCEDTVVLYISRNNVDLTAWPYYTTFPTEDQEYLTVKGSAACSCVAIMVDGILSTDVTTPVSQGKEAIFTAKIMPNYTFSGWYSDEACTKLVSTDNPAYVITPADTAILPDVTYLTLYAKATKTAAGTGFYIKQNGTFVEANAVYKKTTNGWIQITDYTSLFPYGYYLPGS